MVKGNRGEWAQILALFTLINSMAEKKRIAVKSDSNGFVQPKLVRIKQNNLIIEYTIHGNQLNVISEGMGFVVKHESVSLDIPRLGITEIRSILGKGGKGVIQSTPFLDEVLSSVGVNVVKLTFDKFNFEIECLDTITSKNVKYACIVKSSLHSQSSFLNASRKTNIVYMFSKSCGPIHIDNTVLRRDLSEKTHNGDDLIFERYLSSDFENDCLRLHPDFPVILSEAVRIYYCGSESNLSRIADMLDLKPYQNLTQKPSEIMKRSIYRMQSDRFKTEVPGLVFFVDEDFTIYTYDINSVHYRKAVYHSLRFDTPSTKRNDFGYVYSEGMYYKIKLNVQIRFSDFVHRNASANE